MSAMPVAGQKAPDFELPSSEGGTVSLKGLKGRPVVLYFYPKDDTPGCTVEACEFGAEHARLKRAGVLLLGVSPDSLRKHGNFIKKFKLPFPLLSDPELTAIKAYGAWGEKQMFGKRYMGVLRSTFLIGPDGRIARAWPKVSPAGHAAEVLEALRGL